MRIFAIPDIKNLCKGSVENKKEKYNSKRFNNEILRYETKEIMRLLLLNSHVFSIKVTRKIKSGSKVYAFFI